jgi:putative transposase
VKAGYELRLEELFGEIGRLTTKLAWLQKNLVSTLSRTERVKLIEWAGEIPIRTQAELLGLNRTSLYYQPVPVSAEELAIKHRIDELYTAHPFLGSRKISAILSQERGVINRKAVQRHMQEMGIAGICPGPNLSKRRAKAGIFP